MRRSTRLGLLAATAAAALAATGSALAALNPTLTVAGPNLGAVAGPVSIVAKTQNGDDAIAKLAIYAPVGYQLSTPAIGARIGSAAATAVVADMQDKALTLTGSLVSADPKDAAVVQAGSTCDTATHSLVWMLKLSGGGQSYSIPVFVDQSTGSETQFSSYRLVMCFGAPDVPAGTPGRSQAGTRFTELRLSTNAIVSPTVNGEFRWRSVWTPFVPKSTTVATAGVREAQSIVRTPTVVNITAKKRHVTVKGHVRTLVTLSGFLTESQSPIAAVRISLQSGPSKHRLTRMATVSTNAKGMFVKKLVVKSPRYFMAEVTVPLRPLGFADCKATFGATVQCATITIGGSHVLSRVVKVNP